MFLIDNLLMAPGKAVFFLFEELAKKAQEEWLDDAGVKQELQEIYALLDSGKITDAEFEQRERRLLTRLEQIARVKFQSRWAAEGTTAAANDAGPVIDSDAIASFLPRGAAQPQPAGESVETTAALPAAENTGPFSRANFYQALRPFLDLDRPSSEPPAHEQHAATSNVTAASEHPGVSGKSEATVPGERFEIAAPATLADIQPRPASPPVSAAVPTAIQFGDAVESAKRALAVTKLKISSVTSVLRADDGWRVSLELVERSAVPDTNDLLGVYEVAVSQAGIVTGYERTRVRRRNDLR
jgi:hypothetical protein